MQFRSARGAHLGNTFGKLIGFSGCHGFHGSLDLDSPSLALQATCMASWRRSAALTALV